MSLGLHLYITLHIDLHERRKAHINLQMVFVVEKLADGDVITGFIKAIHAIMCKFSVDMIDNNEFIVSVFVIVDEVRSVDAIYACCGQEVGLGASLVA